MFEWVRLKTKLEPQPATLASQVEFATAHEEATSRIGTDEAAFVVEKLGTTDGTKLPPVILLLLLGARRIGSAHKYSSSLPASRRIHMILACSRSLSD